MPSPPSEFRTRLQFVTSASMPYRVYKACVKTGTVSNTRYIQEAVCARLSEDLGIPLDELLDELPPPRAAAGRLLYGVPTPAPTVEEVK